MDLEPDELAVINIQKKDTGLIQKTFDHEPIPVNLQSDQHILGHIQELQIRHGVEEVRVQLLQFILL